MKVGDLMTRNVAACRPTDPLSAAAQLMWDRDCGCVPVVSDDGSNRVVGMLTDRDICMATHFRGVSPGAVRVGEVMSKEVRAIGPSEAPEDAEAVMRDALVRREEGLGRGHVVVGVTLSDLGLILARQGKMAEAETTLTRAIAILRAHQEPTHRDVRETRARLDTLYTMMNRPQDAARERALARP